MRRPLLALLLGALLAGLLTACGGDDRLSKDDYIKQAEAISDRVQKETQSLNTGNVDSPKDLAPLLEKLEQQIESAKGEIEELEPPEEVQEAHDKTVESLDLFLKDLEPVVAAAKKGDTEELQRLTSGEFPSKAAQDASDAAEKIYREKGYEQLAED